MSSTRKTPEHIVPAYNLREDAGAAEAAQSTAAAEVAQPQAAEVAEAAQPAQAAEGRMVCSESSMPFLLLSRSLSSGR